MSEKGEERVMMVYEIAAGRRHHDHHHRSVYKKNFFATTFLCCGDGNSTLSLSFSNLFVCSNLPKKHDNKAHVCLIKVFAFVTRYHSCLSPQLFIPITHFERVNHQNSFRCSLYYHF